MNACIYFCASDFLFLFPFYIHFVGVLAAPAAPAHGPKPFCVRRRGKLRAVRVKIIHAPNLTAFQTHYVPVRCV